MTQFTVAIVGFLTGFIGSGFVLWPHIHWPNIATWQTSQPSENSTNGQLIELVEAIKITEGPCLLNQQTASAQKRIGPFNQATQRIQCQNWLATRHITYQVIVGGKT